MARDGQIKRERKGDRQTQVSKQVDGRMGVTNICRKIDGSINR